MCNYNTPEPLEQSRKTRYTIWSGRSHPHCILITLKPKPPFLPTQPSTTSPGREREGGEGRYEGEQMIKILVFKQNHDHDRTWYMCLQYASLR